MLQLLKCIDSDAHGKYCCCVVKKSSVIIFATPQKKIKENYSCETVEAITTLSIILHKSLNIYNNLQPVNSQMNVNALRN